ncbi:MAG: hypothetical protein Fur0010_10220 [Bdellovibrio sp.]
MCKKSLILFYLISFNLNAKLAREAFQVPCEQLEIKVESCSKLTLNPQPKKHELSYQGALVDALIVSSTPVKCHPKQEVRFELLNDPIRPGKKKIFIKDQTCEKLPSKVFYQRTYCDTPGALMIHDCFVSRMSQKYEFTFATPLD